MSNQAATQITASQEIQQLEGGQATGVGISRVIGNVAITSNTFLYDRPTSPPNPPPLTTIRAYLEVTSRPDKPLDGVSRNEAALWEFPFRAHQAESSQPQDLSLIVEEAFSLHQQQGGFQRLILLADNGMGKTPALHYLRVKRAELSLRSLTSENPFVKQQCIIPLYIRLADLTSDQTLLSLMRDSFNAYIKPLDEVDSITTTQVTGLLEEYKCLFLFDNLGELLASGRLGSLQSLSYFIETYREHQYVITSRTSRYRQQLGSLDSLYLDLLTDDEAATIVGIDQYDRLSPSSKLLARNRKFLSHYIRLGKSSDLLQTTGRLIQTLISNQFEENKKSLEDTDFSSDFLQALLEQLAIQMRLSHVHCYSNKELMDFTTGFLETWNEPAHWRKVTNELVKAEFLVYDVENRFWRFRHRTHESYFAASAVLHDDNLLQLLYKEISDYWWRDVFEMLVGLHPKPNDLLLELIDRDVLVAANSIRFVGDTVGPAVEDALIDALDEHMRLENSLRRKYIVERIAESNHPRAAESLLRVIHRDWSSIVVMAAVKSLIAWQQRTNQSILDVEEKLLETYFGPVESIATLIELCPPANQPVQCDVDKLVAILKRRTNSSKRRGLAAIGLGFSDTSSARDALFDIVINEKSDEFVAWCAVEALTLSKQPEVYEYAAELFRSKKDGKKRGSYIRVRAVYLLGWVGKNFGAEDLLREALYDRNCFVRGYAVEAMSRLDIVGARQEIEQKLQAETEPFVLRKISETLGKIGTVESIPVLGQHMHQGKTGNRLAVRRAIAEIQLRYGM